MFKWVQGPNCNSVATACVALHEVTHILKLDGYLCWFYGLNYRSSPDNYQKKHYINCWMLPGDHMYNWTIHRKLRFASISVE